MSRGRNSKPGKSGLDNDNNAPAPDDTGDLEMGDAFPGADKTPGLADIFRDDEQRLHDHADEFSPDLTDELPPSIVPPAPARKPGKAASKPKAAGRVSAPKTSKSDPIPPRPRAKKSDDVIVATAAPVTQEEKDRAIHTAQNLTSYLARLDAIKRQTEIAAHSASIDRKTIDTLHSETADKLRNLQLVFNLYRMAYNAPHDDIVIDAKQGSTVNTPFGPIHFNENITTDAGKAALLAKGQRILDHIDDGGTIKDINRNLDAMTARLTAATENHTHAFFTTRRTRLPAPVELICAGDTYEERHNNAMQKVVAYFQGPSDASHGSMSTDGEVKRTAQCKVRVIPIDVHIKEKQILSGQPLIAKTATVQINDGAHCRSEFYFTDMSLFNKVKRIRSGLTTSIPGLVTLEWAAHNLNSFRAKMNNPREAINLDTGRLPKELTEALILYCKFKNYKYTAPVGFEVSDKQVELFSATWAAQNAADKSQKEDFALEAKTTFKRPSKS